MKTLSNPDPENLLGQLTGEATPRLVIVTGQSGAGKTKWCTALLKAAETVNLRTAGLLSPPVFEGSEKVGINLTDLSTGETRRLAARRPVLLQDAATRKWLFDDEVVGWANEVLAQVSDCDLFLLDELGPLEFGHGQGFTAAFDVISRTPYRVGVIVVRPRLLDTACKRWPVNVVVNIS